MDVLELMRKRIKINKEINKLEKQVGELEAEIRELEELITQYETCEKYIGEAMEDWSKERENYQNILLESVIVKTYFEGVAAKNVKDKLLPTIASINGAAAKASRIQSAIPKQITLLEERITELEKQIKELQSKISALEAELKSLG